MTRSDLGQFRIAFAGALIAALLVSAPAVSAAIGNAVKIGQLNKGNATTTIKGASPATLKLINTTAGEEALRLVVKSGPALRVSSAARVPKLNADRVDGNHASQLAVPSGAVMFFDLASCPGGWTEYAPARGRTPVGLNPGGTLEGTKGTALSNLQSPTTANHQHAWSVYSGTGKSWKTWGGDGYLKLLVDYGSPPRESGSNPTYALAPHSTHVGSEQVYYTAPPDTATTVNMPYVQLLACEKN